MSNTLNIPKILRLAIQAIQNELPRVVRDSVFRRADRRHKMHVQLVRTLQKLLSVLIGRVDLGTGVICRRTPGGLVDLCISDMVALTGLAKSTVCAALAFLRSSGFMFATPQNIGLVRHRNGTTGIMGSCHRRLTPSFWNALGLAKEFFKEQEKRPDTEIKPVVVIKGVSGIHRGHRMQVPEKVEPRPKVEPAYDRDGLLASIERAKAAQKKSTPTT